MMLYWLGMAAILLVTYGLIRLEEKVNE